MNTEQKFNLGDRVRFHGHRGGWTIKIFHGNGIYTVRQQGWGDTQFAYEHELVAIPLSETLRQSVAQAKAKREKDA